MKFEMDSIYLMGYDVWGDDLSIEIYLNGCRKSKKYALGEWYVLVVDGLVVSSLIMYHDQFGIAANDCGIGSISTSPKFRSNGYARDLIRLMTDQVFTTTETKVIFLHSDIGHKLYEKLGFKCISSVSECMYKKKSIDVELRGIPSYF